MDPGPALADFLDRLADGTPTPGSGAAAALTAAVAAGLVAMACRVTARRAPSGALDGAAASADALRRRTLALAADDVRAYEAVIAARRTSGAARAEMVAAALREATQVPLALARASGEVLALAAARADDVRDAVLGELAVAHELARAAGAAAALTVRLNVRDVGDARFASEVGAALVGVEASAAAAGERLARRLAERTGLPPSSRAAPG